MVEYTENNNTYFSYGGVKLGMKMPGMTLDFHLARCQRPVGTFQEECHDVARRLHAKAARLGRTPTVMLSGGLDSEVTCKAFLEQNLPIDTATFRFSHGKNEHELHFVRRFAARHGLEPWFIDQDAIEFINSPEAKALYFRTQCARPIMLSHMMLLSEIWNRGGMPVLGGGDLVLQNESGWRFGKYEYMLPWFRFAEQEGIDGGIAFFQYTPEMMLAPLNEPEIARILDPSNKLARILKDARLHKYLMYHRIWSDLEKRPKYYGVEMVLEPYMTKMYELNAQRELAFEETWSVPIGEARAALEPVNCAN